MSGSNDGTGTYVPNPYYVGEPFSVPAGPQWPIIGIPPVVSYSTASIISGPILAKRSESKDTYDFLVAMPGVALEDIDVYIRDTILCVHVNTEEDSVYNPFEDLISDHDFDIADIRVTDEVDATLANGILTVKLKKVTPDKLITVRNEI